ncbi:MAG TPA: sulfite exporter TauE/SafE family protein [Chitinophagales bacterium]|nr:sulfite exporter TauE/SafE family protein [Chitinophagales bacterium]
MEHIELLLFFFLIAFIYASVGFGGGSSYIAILALYELPFKEIKLTALICNIIVVTGGTLVFIRNKNVNWKKILPIAIVSVPMAFWGATQKISENTFFIVLGVSLVIAAILLWIRTKSIENGAPIREEKNFARDGIIGGGIGFLSGMVGIGGGIFLSPLLNLLKWDTAKKIAATASFFILVNSIAGIAGQVSSLNVKLDYTRILMLAAAVLAGGQLGSRIGALRFNSLVIRRVTALLVFYAGCEVLFKHLPWFK